MKRKLTDKQRRFAELVVMGESLVTAYTDVYSDKAARHTRAVNASRLAQSPEVAADIAELREKAASSAVVSRVGLLERLWSLNTQAFDYLADKGFAGSQMASQTALRAFIQTMLQLEKLGAVPTLEQLEAEHKADNERRGVFEIDWS